MNQATSYVYGTIFATTDGGSTWVRQLDYPLSTINSISCFDVNTCIAVGQNRTILKTTNGGNNWNSQTLVGGGSLTRVSCASPGTCVAVGQTNTGGIIAASTDGGNNWNTQDTANNNYLYGVSCPSATNCFVVGGNGVTNGTSIILATNNSGATWLPQTSSSNNTLFGITCPDTTTCFATSTKEVIATNNSGALWTTRYSPNPSLGFQDIDCLDALTCFIVLGSSEGASNVSGGLVTTDGGNNWLPEYMGTDTFLIDIHCKSGCIAVGIGGTILSNSLVVTSPTDDGTTGTVGKLSYALNRATAGQSITFAVSGNNIALSNPLVSPLPPLKIGVNLVGSCATPITLDTKHILNAGLSLSGRSVVQGLKLINVNGIGIQANGKGNVLRCTKVSK